MSTMTQRLHNAAVGTDPGICDYHASRGFGVANPTCSACCAHEMGG